MKTTKTTTKKIKPRTFRQDVLYKFGDRMKNLREQRARTHGKKFSQEKLGEVSGLHRNYISDAERGTRNVSLYAIMKITSGLGCTIDEFFSEGFEDLKDDTLY